MKNIANFLFEVGMLARTPRSGFYFLGSGEQSVAEHTHRAVYIGFVLASMVGDVNVERVMTMCLFHDLAEGRTSDLNYVHQKYVKVDEQAAIDDTACTLPFGDKIRDILKEYEERHTKESILAKEADQLEFLLSLREQQDIGNSRAATWLDPVMKRLKTDEGKKLAQAIIETSSDDWWYSNREDSWWVHRNKENPKPTT